MKILIIGKGGREHALAWKIKSSSLVSEVFIAPGNPGTETLGKNISISDTDILSLANFAEINKIDLTVVGPESSLALGVVDEFKKRGLKIFGPSQAAAKIESSKDFAKKIMLKYNIPTSKYATFTDFLSAKEYILQQGAPIVVKEDGLKAGKGVTVATTLDEAIEAIDLAFSIEGNKVVIEECLEGFEFSIIAMVHNDKIVTLEVAQDHKRVFNGDKGPNTGGMGVYSPVDKIDSTIIKDTVDKIMQPMADAMISEGIPFTGFLFGGIMLTKDGVKTIEFNARLGDPETQVILTRMKSDFVQAILTLLNNEIPTLEWDPRYALGVVMASENYPLSSTLGASIEVENLDSETLLFHMGTALKDNNLVTGGGRVLIPVSFGETLESAQKKAYLETKKIKCDKLFYRDDIGNKAF
ncbi:MAG: phosphoribosylamine--glycine ligase [Fusobacteriaceae bacterium]